MTFQLTNIVAKHPSYQDIKQGISATCVIAGMAIAEDGKVSVRFSKVNIKMRMMFSLYCRFFGQCSTYSFLADAAGFSEEYYEPEYNCNPGVTLLQQQAMT